ncbi:tRNA pseudouridine(38-40) synthase TruA [Dokdonia sinensis]|uniref:tRNA pseudouridine synthase A n=1 Tax=Dokdonia sinensis TaxID=2479847 RepID=A0A3M0G8F2_9FLAO|nr:tRNA pseudouridine(38-40) synthase TruA [Dokdonia sinensis]RMB57329.1 tRNA pseudouridine(38-40) synthase TruA [Dokdonia sinensis]
MFEKRFYYLLKIQYLGFRYHGWQKQPDVLTVERMMERTFSYILERKNFKLLAAGRTDAKVSANVAYVELFLNDKPLPENGFLEMLNANLPQDIRCLEITQVDKKFNVIDAPKRKEYIYVFSFGEKSHPFAAPFMINIAGMLDIDLMKQAARLFEGTHDFRNYTYKPNPETQTIGTVEVAEIVLNDVYTANFFPEESFLFRVSGKGFKRHQIRLMMGALFDLGQGNLTLDYFKSTLQEGNHIKLTRIAQASGLILQDVQI